MITLAVDPGKITGLAAWNGEQMTSWEIPGGLIPGVQAVQTLLPQTDLLIYEDFEITSSTARKDLAGSYITLHMIGGLLVAAGELGIRTRRQRPIDQSFAKANNWRILHTVDWYSTVGDGHCNSAAAHLLKYLVDTSQLPAAILSQLIDVEFEL